MSKLLRERQARLQAAKSLISPVTDQQHIDELLSVDSSNQSILIPEFQLATPDESAAERILDDLEQQFARNNLNTLIENARQQVISSVVPLGIGRKLAEHDQLGGNVDTTHNVRNEIYATEVAQQRYEDREAYDNRRYHNEHDNYNHHQREGAKQVKEGRLVDESTGTIFKTNDKGKTDKNLDHVVSSHEVHNDRAANLAGIDTADLANKDENLKFINASVNKTKSDDTLDQYLSQRSDRIESKKKRIQQLESQSNLSEQQQNELKNAKNYVEKQQAVDEERFKKLDQDARKAINSDVDKAYYKSKEFMTNSAVSVGKNGLKMGLSAAFGLLLSNFFNNLFDEVIDCYQNGKESDSLIQELTIRFKRIVQKAKEDWKPVAKAFAVGCVSGFLSEITTILINMFATTSKRIVTCLREGGLSLLRAIQFALFPPAGISAQQATHEASKILCTGLVITGGILLDEVIEKLIVTATPFLTPIANLASGIVSSALVAIVSCLAVYLIDKADLIGAMREKRTEFIRDELDSGLKQSLATNKQLTEVKLPC
ncbi:hypothetical protein DZ860_01620 [Vibrio sinensis]|uniref:Lactate permease n=1 Tax=Vibrio sinensis TaxID=2302434 RepID=A0A3A6QRM5_9VIBR|nr:hypothetical protein [Vibrio sinensis]RJX75405.1 hypothetical protein DZ860_01620 [Vibrio sinensis]